jgi:hypothetical protein
MNCLRGLLVLLLLWLYRLARCVLAGLGLASVVGAPLAAAGVLACAALAWQWPLRVLAAFALWRLWHWPLWVALLAVVPRLWLLLPGLVTAGLARLRHPRPRWPSPAQVRATSPPGA